MYIIIKTYWNKVVYDGNSPFKTRVLDEYELKSTVSYPTTVSFRDQIRHSKNLSGFVGVEDNAIKMDLGKSYGIHSYQMITVN